MGFSPFRRTSFETGTNLSDFGFLPALLCLLLLATGSLAQAQPSPASLLAGDPPPARATNAVGPSTTELTASLRARLDEAQTEFERAQGGPLTASNLPPGATLSEAIEFRSSLQRLVRTFQLHLDDMAALSAARQRQQDLEDTVNSWNGFAEPPPYSVLFVDDLRNALQSLNAKAKAAETTRAVVDEFIAAAHAAMQESEAKLRSLAEQLETAKDPVVVARLTWQRELELARQRNATASAGAFETKAQIANQEMSEVQQRLAVTKRQLSVAARQVTFTQAHLDQVMASLAKEQQQLDGDIRAADADIEARRRDLSAAREELRRALQEQAAGSTNAIGLQRLQELVELRGIQAQTSTLRLTVLRLLVEGLVGERQMWQMRLAVFGSRDLAELQRAYQRLTRLSGFLEVAKPYYRQQIDLAASQITEQQNRLQNQGTNAVDPSLIEARLESYQQRGQFYQRALQSMERREQVVSRWREALDFDRQALPFTARVRDLFTEASTFVAKLWRFELFAVEDTIIVDGQPISGKRAVTVGKIVMAVLILVVGYWLTGLLARLVEQLAVKRLKVEANQASLIRSWARVALLFCLIAFSLVLVKIPLTVFAFAGGALAIGVGFGTQNLLKNFISGIIILFERPFRVGDVLDVVGKHGTVTNIGIRSSVIQLSDGTETLIPNSALLENNLTNWTYSNRTVRFNITVGVAYGSDTRRVAQLLGEVADRHGLVQKEPKPQVLFTEFGDSAVTFELRYWVDVVKHNSSQIASDLRHMIAGTFAENGVAIPFPQRDMRLTADQPIPVQVIPRSDGKASASPLKEADGTAAPRSVANP